MKTFLRLIAASLFVGHFGNQTALAEPPHIDPAGLFTEASDEPDAIITLLDPRESDETILLISNAGHTGKSLSWTAWPWYSAWSHQPRLMTRSRQSVQPAALFSTVQSLDWNSVADHSHESARRPLIH